MAYRRNHGSPSSPIPEELRSQSGDSPSSSSLALCGTSDDGNRASSVQDSNGHRYKSLKNNDSKYDFWDVVAKKARSVLENDNAFQQRQNSNRNNNETHQISVHTQLHPIFHLSEEHRKKESPKIQKSLNGINSSISYRGEKVKKSFDEENSVVENRTDISQETNKLNTRRRRSNSNVQIETAYSYAYQSSTSHVHPDQETQLKAARDVANAMAAKAKLLMRELKTVKSDLSFANERCAQLEEENKILRQTREKRVHPEDDDLICLQLEILLAEKARLTHENSMRTRENRFLREIVEYNQLTAQGVEYLDEDAEEVTDVYAIFSPHSFGAPETP